MVDKSPSISWSLFFFIFNPSHNNWDVLVLRLHFNPVSYMHLQFADRDHFYLYIRLIFKAFLGFLSMVLSSDLHTLQNCFYNIAIPMTEPFLRILGRVALITRVSHFFIFTVIIQQVTLGRPLASGVQEPDLMCWQLHSQCLLDTQCLSYRRPGHQPSSDW